MRIEDALERFLLQLRANGCSEHTVKQNERHIRLFSSWTATTGAEGAVERVTTEGIARFLGDPDTLTRPDGEPKKASSMNALRSSLRGFFRFLDRSGFVTQNPTRLLARARDGSLVPNALSADETKRLLDTLASGETQVARRDHALFALLLGTGMRLGSALQLEVDDFDLERSDVVLRATKGRGSQVVFLPQPLREHMLVWVGEKCSGRVFPGRGGGLLDRRHVQRRLAYWLDKACVRRRYSPHSLRHTFAMNLYERTGDILLVKEALGHQSIESTLIYARADQRRLREALGAA